MGILGLTTFMDNLNNVFEDLKLTNCTLLIDGYSLLHKINNKLNLNGKYGGSYNELHIYLNNFLDLLSKCKIKSYFLFDGAKELNETKSIKRAKQRILNSIKNNTENLLPINAYKILINLLAEHKVKYYQCNFEADYELAFLANNYLKCPILSNDSDYYIYNLTHGYIPIDTIDFELNLDQNTSDYYLNAKLYKIDRFCRKFHLQTPSLLSIFAILCGNDYVDSTVFKSFLLAFINENNNMKSKKAKVNYLKHKFNLYKRILEWLSQSPDVNSCILRILKFIKKDLHEEIGNLIKKSIDNYFYLKNENLNVDLKYIDGIFEDKADSSKVDDLFNNSIDSSFIIKYNKFKYSRLCLDLLLQQRIIYSCQIEVISWPSTYLTSIDIRKFFYSLMLSKYLINFNDIDKIFVKEYLRVNKDLKIYEVEIDKNVNIDELSYDLAVFERIFPELSSIIKSLSDFKGLNNEIKIFYLMLFYWLSTSYENVGQLRKLKNLNSIRSFIVSFIKYSIIDELNDKLLDCDDDLVVDDLRVFTKQNQHNFTSFDDYLNFLQKSKINSSQNVLYLKEIYKKLIEFQNKQVNRVDLKYIHCLCEFQAIYQSVSLVNEYFDDSKKFCLINLNRFYNGSFLYYFKNELDSRVNPDLYIEELFSRKSLFSSLYKLLFDSFVTIFNIDILSKSFNDVKIEDPKEDADNNEFVEIIEKEKFVDENNKFSCLVESCEDELE